MICGESLLEGEICGLKICNQRSVPDFSYPANSHQRC